MFCTIMCVINFARLLHRESRMDLIMAVISDLKDFSSFDFSMLS